MTDKSKFLQKFNEAFANNDVEYLSRNVTDDIHWKVIGDQTIQGKEAFTEALKQMATDEPFDMVINNLIIDGNTAVMDGKISSSTDGKTYAVCDIYKFSDSDEPKIKEMTSYALELKEG